eukprot:288627_1
MFQLSIFGLLILINSVLSVTNTPTRCIYSGINDQDGKKWIYASCLYDSSILDTISQFNVPSSAIPDGATIVDLKLDFRGFVYLEDDSYVDLDGFLTINQKTIVLFGNKLQDADIDCSAYHNNFVLSLYDTATGDYIDGPSCSFDGDRRPKEPISNLAGVNANGEWKLEIINNNKEVFGNFRSLDMIITFA